MDRFQLLSDLELLIALCSEHDDDKLYTEFVNRFHEELKEECIKICKKRKLDLHIGKQICDDVFGKLRKYKSFKADQIKTTPEHKGILVYLFRIANNLFIDWHNEEKRSRTTYVSKNYFEKLTESLSPPEGVEVLLWKKEVTLSILKKLSAKEKVVMFADVEHKKHQCYLPDEVTERLSEKLDVTKASIRKIRERGLKKIKQAINEINQQSTE